MRYLLLAYADEGLLEAMPLAERATLAQACRANDEALRRSGHLLASESLQRSDSATTVRVRGGRLALAEGPFAATQEQLSGLFLIDARDLNEAIQVAACMPQARGGSVEVRPIVELPRQTERNQDD